jgi:transcriptional regulator with XRE-family HTH domain
MKLTQKQVADLINKDRSLITKIENNTASPSVETAKALGQALNFDWTILFNDSREYFSHDSKGA